MPVLVLGFASLGPVVGMVLYVLPTYCKRFVSDTCRGVPLRSGPVLVVLRRKRSIIPWSDH